MILKKMNNNKKGLPKNRKEQVIDICTNRFEVLLRISLLTTLFYLPLILWLSHSDITLKLMISNMLQEGTTLKSEYIYKIFIQIIIFMIVSLPLVIFLSFGYIGLLYYLRNLLWDDIVFLLSDFIKSIKKIGVEH